MKFNNIELSYNKETKMVDGKIGNKHISIELEFSPNLTLDFIDCLSDVYIKYLEDIENGI